MLNGFRKWWYKKDTFVEGNDAATNIDQTKQDFEEKFK